ncbi:MAG: CYTH domain-containing protein [Candidatus Margulisbacteria bacterium]|nr:CYTH domain-containing protein [Candidatus Margulisiibacteriota bacterium]
MIKEIERKFLIKKLPTDYFSNKHAEIIQGYISVDGDGTEVRLRELDKTYTMTVKTGKGLIRDEYEITISLEHYNKFWPTTSGRRIKKTRYYLPYNEFIIQLDVYHGHLKGLFVAEIEFCSVDESATFVPPQWFGEEVTTDVKYKNKNIAIYGINLR